MCLGEGKTKGTARIFAISWLRVLGRVNRGTHLANLRHTVRQGGQTGRHQTRPEITWVNARATEAVWQSGSAEWMGAPGVWFCQDTDMGRFMQGFRQRRGRTERYRGQQGRQRVVSCSRWSAESDSSQAGPALAKAQVELAVWLLGEGDTYTT